MMLVLAGAAQLRLACTLCGGAVGIVSPSSSPAGMAANRISGTTAFESCLASVTELFGRFALLHEQFVQSLRVSKVMTFS
ncbi:hypothetical protein ACP70R_001992 [Stipagrostis hirtigluma subsp. patula]